jgi:Bacterial Ig domain
MSLRIFVNTVMVCSLYFIFVSPSFASTYYVRLDGGTAAQCTGATNTPYSGSGSNQPCAFNHPAWVIGTPGVPALLKGGDTLIIDDTNHTTGLQAQYKIGYRMPNTVSSNCNLSSSYDCTMSPIPSGPDAANPTTIEGIGYNSGCTIKPQLWGSDGTNQIFDLSNTSNISLACMELTDHSNCGFRVGNPTCTENWNSAQLSGPWSKKGIYALGGTNFTFTNLDVHGFAERGFLMGGINGLIFDHVNMDGNNWANWDSDVGESTPTQSYNSGTIFLNYVKNRFAGCSEAYPRSPTFNTADYSNCTDELAGGYGDGYGGFTTGGNWIVQNSEFSHNTQDGLDLLYHDRTGSVSIQRSLFEGNNGNQIKITSPATTIANSIVIGNCNYLSANGKVFDIGTWHSCRAGGDAVIYSISKGGKYQMFNTDIYADGNSDVLFTNNLGTCNGTEVYQFVNNIDVGGGKTSLYENTLPAACLTPFNTNSTIIFKIPAATCPAGLNFCATNPQWVSSISQTLGSNLPSVNLQSTSPAKGAAAVIFGASNLDYNNYSRGASWDIGALEYGSVASGTGQTPQGVPVVSLINPSSHSTFTIGSRVNFSATASETGGSIASVSYYKGTTLLGSSSTSPYNYVWTNAPAGTYTLTAKATDAKGVSRTSSPNTVIIKPPASKPVAVVAIISPHNQSTFTQGSNISLVASSTEKIGTISRVYFFDGSTLLGSDGNSLYNYVWTNVPVGTYTFKAVAVDVNGVSTTSSPITVTVR